jgi:hypothetical protein
MMPRTAESQSIERLHSELKQCLLLVLSDVASHSEYPSEEQKIAVRTLGWGGSLAILLTLGYNWESILENAFPDVGIIGGILACLMVSPAVQAEYSLLPTCSIQKLGDLPTGTLRKVKSALDELHSLEILPRIYFNTPITNVIVLMQDALHIVAGIHERITAKARQDSSNNKRRMDVRLFTLVRHINPDVDTEPAAVAQHPIMARL